MDLKLFKLDTAAPHAPAAHILIIYTGGTFGMGKDENGSLVPFNFGAILEYIPNLKSFDLVIDVLAFTEPIDSSNMDPENWVQIGQIIEDYYDEFDGFIILHGTDTMAFTASATSYMLENLSKPVIFTGAQLPITAPRSDAIENLVTSIEIASARNSEGGMMIQEVCIFFNYLLIRGNRAKKVESQYFDAFESENYPPLARAGVEIEYNHPFIHQSKASGELKVAKAWDTSVAYLKMFPGMQRGLVQSVLQNPAIKGVILETYGSGNGPTHEWFAKELSQASDRGLVMFNVSQCLGGRVMQGKYETSRIFESHGVVSGRDITTEAAVTKMMYLLGKEDDLEEVKIALSESLRGEMI